MRPDSSQQKPRFSNYIVIFCLVVAGEMIFGLPYHVARYFRPTLLKVFDLSNAELGDAFAVYGIFAMLSYFPSGVIADKFSARKLMAFSLFATALGGLYMAMIPGQVGLAFLFGYWGITNILLFWSAMLRATREWGGELAQGRAFGILDGGRGLVAAGAATGAVFLLSLWLSDDLSDITNEQRTNALMTVIYFYSLLTFATGILVWFLIPDSKISHVSHSAFGGIRKVMKNRSTWLQAVIVVAAYCGYRGLDYYALYAVDMLGMNELEAARFVSYSTYLRAVAAIAAGFLADRISTSKVIVITFLSLSICYLFLVFLVPGQGVIGIVYGNLILTYILVYALRGVYFALFEETKIKNSLTGTTIGLVSVIGFTPDIFFNSIVGRILDASPGIEGYHNFYMFLGLFSVIGIVATIILIRIGKGTVVFLKDD